MDDTHLSPRELVNHKFQVQNQPPAFPDGATRRPGKSGASRAHQCFCRTREAIDRSCTHRRTEGNNVQDMELTGARLGDKHIFVCAVRFLWRSAAPFAVCVKCGSFKEITDPSGSDFLSAVSVSVRGEITQKEPAEWGPDAKVVTEDISLTDRRFDLMHAMRASAIVKAQELAENFQQCVEELAGCIVARNVEAAALAVRTPVFVRGLIARNEQTKHRWCVTVDSMCQVTAIVKEPPLMAEVRHLTSQVAVPCLTLIAVK